MNLKNGYISIIINPNSGRSSKKLMVKKFIEYLKDKDLQLEINYTKSLAHARRLASQAAVKYDCSMVIAAGGDGTVREVVHGLEGSDKPLMILPVGTENLLANELGYRFNFKTAVKVFEEQNMRPLDLCKANDYFFTSVGGVGFDGEVVKLVDSLRKGNITHLHYFRPILQTFMNYDFPKIKIEIDGETAFDDRGIAIFGNISRYAIGLPILQTADYGDGFMDVCIYKCSGKIALLKHALMTVLKKHRKSKNVIYRRCKTLKISSETQTATEIDGDPGPKLPLEITVNPQAVNILVPAHGKPAGMRKRIFKIFE